MMINGYECTYDSKNNLYINLFKDNTFYKKVPVRDFDGDIINDYSAFTDKEVSNFAYITYKLILHGIDTIKHLKYEVIEKDTYTEYNITDGKQKINLRIENETF
jgi:hypothetical protein